MGFFNLGAAPSQVGIDSIQKPSVFNKEYLGYLTLNKLDM